MKFCRSFFPFLVLLIFCSCSKYKIDNSQADIFEFKIDTHRVIVVPAKIGSVVCNLMIDTGSDISVLRKDFAKKIDKSFDSFAISFYGMQGIKIDSVWRAKQDLTIGDFKFPMFDFIKADLNHFTLKNIHGIIGTDILKHCILKLDYSNKKGFFIPFNKFETSKFIKKYEKVKINKNSYITVKLDDRDYKMLIDSGAENLSLDIDNSIQIRDAIQLRKITSKYNYIYSSYNFEGDVRKSNLGFNINKINIKPIIYTTYPFKNFLSQRKREFSCGINFISKLDWIFDYANNYVYILKPDDFSLSFDLSNYKIKEAFSYPKEYGILFLWEKDKNPLQDIFDIKKDDKVFAINQTSYKECIEKFGKNKGYDIFLDVLYSLDFDTITVIRNGKKITLARK